MSRGRLLSFEEREVVSRDIARQLSSRFIAQYLGRHPSVISREIARNGGRENYRAVNAQRNADIRSARPKERKLEDDEVLHDKVNEGLGVQWSPQQISRYLRTEFPDDPTMRVSHETIYQTLFLQARGQLRTELKLALRTGRTRRASPSSAPSQGGKILDMVMIADRPSEADDRSVPGFWEGDLIIGKDGKSQIATLVERQTRFVMLVKIPYDRTAERVAYLLAKKMETLPKFLRNSITWDQGKEMARHADFTIKTGIPIYFCDPHAPWQRGTNENTNGLLRQYFPKRTDLSAHSQAELDAVADQLNNRPRQTLGWQKPTDLINKLLTETNDALTT